MRIARGIIAICLIFGAGSATAMSVRASQRRQAISAMNSSYNRIAGQSVERLAALSDGVLAVAMTLLVLDLRSRYSKNS
jgi:hypothetical protein